jgi:hypothetical protein
MDWHRTPTDDAWKQAHLAMVEKLGKRPWLGCGNFGDGPGEIERAQHRLAAALLSVANEDSRDVEVLKQAALLRMVLDYRAMRASTSS